MVYVEYDNILTFVFALPPFLLLLLPFIMALAIAIDYNGGKPWWLFFFRGRFFFLGALLGCTVHFAWDGWMGESKMGGGKTWKIGWHGI